MAKATTIDAYIATQPEGTRETMENVRSTIRKAIPTCVESISYDMPTYKLDGTAVIFFAAWKKHFSIYPASAALVAAFATDLEGHAVEKGTIRFPLAAPPPLRLIARLAKFRLKEVNGG